MVLDLAVQGTTVFCCYFVFVYRTTKTVNSVRFCTAVLKKILCSSCNQIYVQKRVLDYVVTLVSVYGLGNRNRSNILVALIAHHTPPIT